RRKGRVPGLRQAGVPPGGAAAALPASCPGRRGNREDARYGLPLASPGAAARLGVGGGGGGGGGDLGGAARRAPAGQRARAVCGGRAPGIRTAPRGPGARCSGRPCRGGGEALNRKTFLARWWCRVFHAREQQFPMSQRGGGRAVARCFRCQREWESEVFAARE